MTIKPALALLAIATFAPQTRDAAMRVGTATVSGVVITDDPSNRPIPRVTVSLATVGGVRGPLTTATDDAGRFTFSGVPAGNLTLVATKPAYLTTYFGAKRPGATLGVPIAVTDGERIGGLTIRMPRGGVITGTVFDEAGRPMPGAPVRLRQMSVSPGGSRTLVNVTGVVVPTTDDRGVYRVYGLPPGDYLVAVQPRVTGTGELRQPTPAELQWAEQQIRSAGRGTAPGSAPSPPPAPGAPMTYANIFHPAATNEAAATPVSVAVGQERNEIDIRAQFVATARLEGTVSDQGGQPASGVSLTLVPHDAFASSAVSATAGAATRLLAQMEAGLVAGTSARTTATGAFTIAGVAPGHYTLMASTTGRPGGPAVAGLAAGLWAAETLTVDGQDRSGIALTLTRGMTVSGQLAFAGSSAPPGRLGLTLSAAQPAGAAAASAINVSASVPAFSFAGLAPGRYRFNATAGAWTLASAMLGGRDVADEPFEIRAGEDVPGLVATFIDNAPELAGTLTDSAGRPAPSFAILLFSTDRALWYAGSRRVRAPVSTATDGSFSFRALTPGEYYLAALTDVSATEWVDPVFLEHAALLAVKVTLNAGEKKTQALRLAGR